MKLFYASLLKKTIPITGIIILYLFAYYWMLTRWYGLNFSLPLNDALLSATCVTLSCILLELIIKQYSPKVGKFQFVTGVSLALSVVCYWIYESGLKKNDLSESYLTFSHISPPLHTGLNLVILLGWGFYTLAIKQQIELKESNERQQNINSMLKEAELKKLQLQLQPHFLFNSLNSINALILANPAKAQNMVEELSSFLRTTLKRADEIYITLHEELIYLQSYLCIEKIRFGHRLNVQIDCNEELKQWLIPPLIIQPLVENAIKYGLYGTTDDVQITLIFKQLTPHEIQLEISNPFDPDMKPSKEGGFGLNGLRRRLYLLYARNDLIKTTVSDHFFMAKLFLPKVSSTPQEEPID